MVIGEMGSQLAAVVAAARIARVRTIRQQNYSFSVVLLQILQGGNMMKRYGFGIRDAAISALRHEFVRLNTKHLSGPRSFHLKDGEVVVILLGRNIMHSAAYFLDYYRDRGAIKLVYMDNGSNDGSEIFFSNQPDVIVVQCQLNFRKWQRELRYSAASDYAIGGWRLAVDADELLDFQGSNYMSIPNLVESLNEKGFTGLIAQMLEMVPRGSLTAHEDSTFAECVEEFSYYSTDAIDKTAYHSSSDPLYFFASKNYISHPGMEIMRGGLRRTVFGEDCLLTKHVLFKAGPDVLPLPHPHFTCGLRIADHTAVLYHYKFAGRYLAKESRLDREGRLSHSEGKSRLRKFHETGDIVFDFDGLKSNPTIPALVGEAFLLAPQTMTA